MMANLPGKTAGGLRKSVTKVHVLVAHHVDVFDAIRRRAAPSIIAVGLHPIAKSRRIA